MEAAPPSAIYRLGKIVRKHRAWLVTAAAFTALLVTGVVVSSWMAVRATRAELEARAVNDILRNGLLAQASANQQAGPATRPDPDLKVRTALDRAAARIEGRFPTQPLVEASIRQTMADMYKDLGLYPEAQRQMERALDLRVRVLGKKHRDTFTSMSKLANLYMKQGKFAQAEPLFKEVMEWQRRVLGEEHPETLESMSGLGEVYGYQGDYVRTEPLFTKVLEVRRRVLGEEHPDTLLAMNNLAALSICCKVSMRRPSRP